MTNINKTLHISTSKFRKVGKFVFGLLSMPLERQFTSKMAFMRMLLKEKLSVLGQTEIHKATNEKQAIEITKKARSSSARRNTARHKRRNRSQQPKKGGAARYDTRQR